MEVCSRSQVRAAGPFALGAECIFIFRTISDSAARVGILTLKQLEWVQSELPQDLAVRSIVACHELPL